MTQIRDLERERLDLFETMKKKHSSSSNKTN